jgi:hypothetical protein
MCQQCATYSPQSVCASRTRGTPAAHSLLRDLQLTAYVQPTSVTVYAIFLMLILNDPSQGYSPSKARLSSVSSSWRNNIHRNMLVITVVSRRAHRPQHTFCRMSFPPTIFMSAHNKHTDDHHQYSGYHSLQSPCKKDTPVSSSASLLLHGREHRPAAAGVIFIFISFRPPHPSSPTHVQVCDVSTCHAPIQQVSW